SEETVFKKVSYVPLMGSFQQIFGPKYRHLQTKISNSDGYDKTWNFYSNYYFGYRVSGGTAFVLDSDFDMGEELPISIRAEFLFGLADRKHFSYINASIGYDALILGESASIDSRFLGALFLNWTLSFSTRSF
ncbi:MAG: hypothetical protein MI749_15855, partial [Desulfovibrionales bacterium]|nr:hypothetical protein [Desulfovibrionales bacterium]